MLDVCTTSGAKNLLTGRPRFHPPSAIQVLQERPALRLLRPTRAIHVGVEFATGNYRQPKVPRALFRPGFHRPRGPHAWARCRIEPRGIPASEATRADRD